MSPPPEEAAGVAVKVYRCQLCQRVLKATTEKSELDEAEQNFGVRPTGGDDDDFDQVCHACFLSLSLCVRCNERWLSTAGPCPKCGSEQVRRGQVMIDYDKARGVIGDGQVDFSKERR